MGATSSVTLVNYLTSLNLGYLICKMRTCLLEMGAQRKVIFSCPNPGFLHLSSTDISDQVETLLGGPVLCISRCLTVHLVSPHLYPLSIWRDAGDTSPTDMRLKKLQTLPAVPWEANPPQLRTSASTLVLDGSSKKDVK